MVYLLGQIIEVLRALQVS